jgi:integrase
MLKGALNLAWEHEKIADDRAWRRVPNFKGVCLARIDFLTSDECRNLIMACNPVFRPIIMALLYTGCRIAELLDLRAEDVSRVRMAVHIKKSKFYCSRHISLPEEGYRLFKSLSFGKDRQTILFLRPNGDAWTKHFLYKELKCALGRANLSNGLVFHTLRHTYASLRLQEGVSPVAVARQLGHRDVRTVLQIYAHCTDDFIDEEFRKRFTPIIEGDPVLSALIEEDGEALSVVKTKRKPVQAALSRRIAR